MQWVVAFSIVKYFKTTFTYVLCVSVCVYV